MGGHAHRLTQAHRCPCTASDCTCARECVSLLSTKAARHLGVLVHGLLHVLQQVVVGSALLLVDVDDAVEVREVAVQVHPLGVAAAHEPVL